MATDDKKQPPLSSTPPPPTAGDARVTRGATVAADMIKVTVAHTAPLGLPPMTIERAKQLGLADQRQDFPDRQLTVGENTIPSAHWNAVKDQTPVRNWIEEGMLYEGADRNAQTAPSGPTFRESLSSLREDEAQRFIDSSNDPAQLSQWLTSERRPAVHEAIQRRMDAIGAGK